MSEPDSSSLSSRGLGRAATIASVVLWVLGFALAFVIPAGSPAIFVPDTLLLAGFLPLMLVWRPIWPWFAFGLCNVFIGVVLFVAQFLPDGALPGDMPKVRQHLAELHVPMVWVLFGSLATLYGTVRAMCACAHWLIERRRR